MVKKSLQIIYKCTRSQPPDPGIVINNVRIHSVYRFGVILLGHYLFEDIYKFNASKCVSDFNRQSNMFFANSKHANSYIRNVLFHKYCRAFYGSQVLPMFGDRMQVLYTAWKIAVHRVWGVPWTTHCVLFLHLAGYMDIELWFSRRCIRCLNMGMKSDNAVIRTIINMGIEGFRSVYGEKLKINAIKIQNG